MPIIVTLPRIGDGTQEKPFRPATAAKNWRVLEEVEDGYIVEILPDIPFTDHRAIKDLEDK